MVSDLLEFSPDNMDPTKITPGGKVLCILYLPSQFEEVNILMYCKFK